MRRISALILLCFSLSAMSTDDVLIHAGEQAVIEFRFEAPPVAENGEPVNFLILMAGGSYLNFTGQSRLYQTLLDGNTTLAVREAERGGGLKGVFVDETHPWEGVSLDFSSIQDGSIQGRLIVRPEFDQPGTQSRIRFSGRLITGHVDEDSPLSAGPVAEILSCRIEASIFRDRFSSDLPPPTAGLRDCSLGG